MKQEQIRKNMEGQFNLTIFLNNLAKEEERLVSQTPGTPISDVDTGKVNILNDLIETLECYTSHRPGWRKRVS
jgi:hypothetical protein